MTAAPINLDRDGRDDGASLATTFHLDRNGRPTHNLTPDPDVTTGGATVIPDVTGLPVPDAARVYRQHGLAVFPWRLVDGGKNLGAFVGKGYHQLAAALTPDQACELAALDGSVTGLGLSAGRSGLIVFDLDRPELCPPLLRRAIDECAPPYQTTRDAPALAGLLPRGHYVFRTPRGRRMGSPSKWQVTPGAETWGEVRCWNSGIAIAPGLHPKRDQGGRYRWERVGSVPELPWYLAETLPEFTQTADPATRAELAEVRKAMRRRTDPGAVGRATALWGADGTASGRHGATLHLALHLAREMVAGRITLDDVDKAVHEFFYSLVSDPSRKSEPATLVEWAVGQVLSDAATGGVAGVPAQGVETALDDAADVTAPGVRVERVSELYSRSAGRPIGLADDIERTRATLARARGRVANAAAALHLIEALDKDVVPLILERDGMGTLRAGSAPEKAAAHHARADALRDGIAAGLRTLDEHLDAEVEQYTAADGIGAPLDAVLHARWAGIGADALAAAVADAYREALRGDATTPNYDAAGALPKDRAARVLGDLDAVLTEHARRVVARIAAGDQPARELPQPPPAEQVPILLDSDELRINGVETFLNSWSPDPEDTGHNGDLFIHRGRPALYTHRGGQIAERREIRPVQPYELISLTNERADVRRGEEIAELTEQHAKVGLAAVRRTLARTLTEVSAAPVITPGNALVPDRTYDPETGVLVACNVPHWLAPADPDASRLRRSLDALEAFYGDFAFKTPGDRAAFWGYLFTVPLRRWLNADGWVPVPGLGIRAGKANAGKTLLSTAVGGLHGAASRRLPEGEEELRKTVLSAYESHPEAQVLIWNNIPNGTILDSATMAELITEPTVEGRKLGHTGEDIRHRNNKVVIVNGNRWRPHDDLVSRFVPCAVRSVVGKDRRTFRTPDLERRVQTPQHHAEVLFHLHVVIRAWLRDGAPTGSTHGIRGNFARWAEAIDGLLTYAGIAGFGTNFSVFAELEEDSDGDFLAALADHLGVERHFAPDEVEKLLSGLDRTAATDPTALNGVQKAMHESMPRDAKAMSPTGSGRKAPLTGNKLSRMLNTQVDMPVERPGLPVVELARCTVAGVRGWKFVAVP